MPEENVDILRSALEGARSDPEALFAILDPEVEWDTVHQMPDGAVTVGVASVRKFFRGWVGAFEDYSFVVEEMIDAGDDVFVVMRHRGTGRTSGVLAEAVLPQVWTLRDGKVVRYRGFTEEADARRAAGLQVEM